MPFLKQAVIRQMKYYKHEEIFESIDFPARKKNEPVDVPSANPSGKGIQSFSFEKIKPSERSKVIPAGYAESAKKEQNTPKKPGVMQHPELVIHAKLIRAMFPQNAAALLQVVRKYLWEKPDPQAGIHPHDKLLIILAMAGEKGIDFLYNLVTVKEKDQIQEILKRPSSFSPERVTETCKEFESRLRAGMKL